LRLEITSIEPALLCACLKINDWTMLTFLLYFFKRKN
jgi:hypothetical protein